MKQVLFVVNPKAGRGALDLFEQALTRLNATLTSQGKPAVMIERIMATQDPEQMRFLLRQRLQEASWDAVGVMGGDGTIMEILPVMVGFPHIPLAVIPGGTGNLLVANLGLPKDIESAVGILVSGQPRQLDVARLGADRCFLLMAGVGVVADIMNNTPRTHKRWIGPLAYLLHGLKAVFHVSGSRFLITTEDRTLRIRAMAVMVSNAASFLGPCLPFTPNADPRDGLLDICVVKGRSVADCLQVTSELLQPHHAYRDRKVIRFQSRRVRIESTPVLPIQADGNLLGETPVDIEILPGAVLVLVPPSTFESSPGEAQRATLLESIQTIFNLKALTHTFSSVKALLSFSRLWRHRFFHP